MFSTTFFVIAGLSLLPIMAQWIAAYYDGYFNQRQIREYGKGKHAFAIIEHGGLWADIFCISLALGLIISGYELGYRKWWSLCLLVVSVILTYLPVRGYEKAAITVPEAHTHDGITTAAGWIHMVYASVVMWVLILFYLTTTTPKVSPRDLLIVTSLMTIWAPLGVIKFNPQWKWVRANTIQVGAEIAIFWAITITRIVMKW